MLILTNGLTDSADEGFLNVANNLIKRLKEADKNIQVISYERKSKLTDKYLNLNKLLLNKELISLLRKNNAPLLYIPFPAPMLSTALRIFILSLFANVTALLVMRGEMNFLSKLLMKMSGADIIVLSEESKVFYGNFLPENKVRLIKAGVDCNKFVPVNREKSETLKAKYGFDKNKPVILHVGHLNEGRNLQQLMRINPQYQILIVTSTLTKSEQDISLKSKLCEKENVKIIDDYIENINEIYQLSDVYVFPVVESGHCIDLPLSCLEAAACGLPVVTTKYGAMKEFIGKKGFYFIDSFENLNEVADKALGSNGADARESVAGYDWKYAVNYLLNLGG